MHGLHGNREYPESKWEVPFRAKLEQIARQKRCRIAAPFGNFNRSRNWNGVSLSTIKTRARSACGGATWVARPSLIGFSNGANVIRKMAVQSCSRLKSFARITLIGPTGRVGNDGAMACGNVQILQPHVVPSLARLSQGVVAPSVAPPLPPKRPTEFAGSVR